MKREIFLVIIHVEHRLRGIHHPPHDRDPDLDGIAEAVVDLLAVVVERHDFQRDLPARELRRLRGSLRPRELAGDGEIDVPALVQLGARRGVDALTEGVDEIESLALQRADIFAEQREHERLLRFQNLKTGNQNPEEAEICQTYDKEGGRFSFLQHHAAEYDADDGRNEQSDGNQHDQHAVFFPA